MLLNHQNVLKQHNLTNTEELSFCFNIFSKLFDNKHDKSAYNFLLREYFFPILQIILISIVL